MTESGATERLVVLAFVRGDEPYSELAQIGVTVALDSQLATVRSGSAPIVEVTVSDVQRGLSAFAHDRAALRSWARVMLMANFIDFRQLQASPEGRRTLELIWDLAYET